jgi:hypothetical protein
LGKGCVSWERAYIIKTCPFAVAIVVPVMVAVVVAVPVAVWRLR